MKKTKSSPFVEDKKFFELLRIQTFGQSVVQEVLNADTIESLEELGKRIDSFMKLKAKEIVDACYKRKKKKRVNMFGNEVTYWSHYINNKKKMYKKLGIGDASKVFI